jgi:ABC-type sulfate/molybdate transport systems ATPase subunit
MIWHPLLLSVQVTAVATLLLLVLGVGLAWLLARHRFRGQTMVETVINLPLVLPPSVVGYYLLLTLGRGSPLMEWLGLHLLFTWPAAVLASAVVGLPLMVQATRAAIASVDPALENAARTLALLERMRLAHLADRYPHELSGGQQQRVAIARALAAEPQVMLLDEPFSGLDAAVREHLQRDLHQLQQDLGLVVLYVTHNLEDAFVIGHRLALIRDGQVEQIGPIAEVFRRPATSHAAAILGVRNLFRARVVETTPEGLLLDWDGLPLEAPPQPASVGDTVTAYIRPEDIKVLYPDRPLTSAVRHNQVTGSIRDSRSHSSFHTLRVAIPNGQEVEVRFPAYAYTPLRLTAGAPVRLSLRKEGVVLLPGKAMESV